MTLAPDNARGGVAAVLNDPICSKGKYFVLEVRTAGHMGRCSYRQSCAAIVAERMPLTQLDGDAVAQLFITYEWSDWCAAVGLLSRMSPSSQLWWPDASNRRNAQVWWVQSVYVAPEHRRKGYYRRAAANRPLTCTPRSNTHWLHAKQWPAPFHQVSVRPRVQAGAFGGRMWHPSVCRRAQHTCQINGVFLRLLWGSHSAERRW